MHFCRGRHEGVEIEEGEEEEPDSVGFRIPFMSKPGLLVLQLARHQPPTYMRLCY